MFGDSSVISNYTIVYAMVYQLHSINPDFIVSKFGIFNSNLTIPSSELVLAHISASLVANTKKRKWKPEFEKSGRICNIFFYLFFLSQTLMNHRTAGGKGRLFL